jgi:hypothetical protein
METRHRSLLTEADETGTGNHVHLLPGNKWLAETKYTGLVSKRAIKYRTHETGPQIAGA